jgi:tubulin-specific chaperone A
VRAYEDEVKTNEARIQKMRDDGRDPHDIRKQVHTVIPSTPSAPVNAQEEVLGESYMMIPDSKGRLARSFEELRSYMVSAMVCNSLA